MFANLYLARTFDINFSAVKMAVGGWRHEGHLGRRTRRQFALSQIQPNTLIQLDTPKWFTLYTVFQTCLCFFMTWYYELVWSSNVFLTYSLNMGLALLVHFRT